MEKTMEKTTRNQKKTHQNGRFCGGSWNKDNKAGSYAIQWT
jgi:hypothetical protein